MSAQGPKPHRLVTDRLFSKIDAAVGEPTRTDLRREMQEWADRIQPRIDDLEIGLRHVTTDLQRDVRQLMAQRALFLAQTTSALDAMGAIHDRLTELEERVEFIRREALLEIRSLGGPGPSRVAPEPPARVPDGGEPWTPPPGPLRLNVGCGPVLLDGYVNVDARSLPGVDLVADVHDLPVPEGSVIEIHAAHILEHFTIEDSREHILPHWRSLLAPDGILRVVVPDADAMARAYAAGAIGFSDLNMVIFGGQEYVGNDHHAMFDSALLRSVLEAAGFDDVRVIAAGRPNGACLELEVEAHPARSEPAP